MSITGKSLVAAARKSPVLVICGVLALLLVAVVYMRADLVDQQQQELEGHSAELRKHRANIANAAHLQEQLDFLMQANAAVRERAMSAEGIAQNLQYFYKLESEVGIKYLDLRPGARSASKGNYVPLNYIVNVQGDFLQIITFLRHLERGSFFCRINSALVSSSGATVTLNLNLDLLGTP